MSGRIEFEIIQEVNMRRVFLIVILIAIALFNCGEDLFDQKFKVPGGFKPSYKVVKIESYPFAGADRKAIKITLPKGLSKEQIRHNLIDCTRVQYVNLNQPDAISINAYRQDSDATGMYDAKCIFAPYGKWEKAESGAPFRIFQFKIDISEQYFREPKTLKVGDKIKLNPKDSSMVFISKKRDSWDDEDMLIRVPAGTPAEIKKFKYFRSIDLLRYKVKLIYKGNEFSGWVNKWDIEGHE
jgi:hypothetical protein